MTFKGFFFTAGLIAFGSTAYADASLPPVNVPPGQQIIANRGELPWYSNSAGGGSTNYTRGEYRQKLTFAPVAASDLRICYGNYYSSTPAPTGEAPGLNAITIEAGIELTSPATTVMATWSGAKTITLQPGAQACSDAIPVDTPANGIGYLRTGVTVASGNFWPTATYFYSSSSDGLIESTSAASQIANTGALSVPSGGAVAPSSTGFPALAILGTPKSKIRSAIIIGDSISIGVADTSAGDGNGNVGFISRSLAANAIPYTRLGRTGEYLQGEAGAPGILRRFYARHATVAVTNGGTNDLTASRTASAVETDLTTLWTALKARGIKVYHVLLPPHTTSTDAWATPGNQTYATGYAPGGARDQINAWVKSQVGILIDGYFDPAPYVEDAANPGKWASPASAAAAYTPGVALTTDGLHLNATATTALTSGMTSFIAGF